MRFSFNFEDGSDIVIRATKEDYDSKFFVWDADRTYPNAQKTGLTYEQAKWLTENFEWIESDRTQPSIMFSCLVDLFEAYSLSSALDYLKNFKHKLRTPEKSQRELWVEWYREHLDVDEKDMHCVATDEDGEAWMFSEIPRAYDISFGHGGRYRKLQELKIPGCLDWKQSCIAVSEIWPEVGVEDRPTQPDDVKMITKAKLDSVSINDERTMSLSYSDAQFVISKKAESIGCDESNDDDEINTPGCSQSALTTSQPIGRALRPKETFCTLRVESLGKGDLSIPSIENNQYSISRMRHDKKMHDELHSNIGEILYKMKSSGCKEAIVVFKLENGSATLHDIHVIVPKPSQPVANKEINLNSIEISHKQTLSEYRESQREVIEPRNKTFDIVAGLGVVSKITGR